MQKRREVAAPSLTVDGGGLLFGETPLSPAMAPQARATARGIVEAYNIMGYNAVGVGRYDLAGGVDFLREMAAASKFSWLSANLVDRADRKPLFAAKLFKKAGGITVGITGLTGPGGPPSDRSLLLPWQEALPPVVAELKKKADFIVLLADLDRAQIDKIAAALPAVNLIIQAGGNAGDLAPVLSHQTLVCSTAKQGKSLGVLSLDWQGRPNWGQSPEELLLDRKRALDQIEWQLRRAPSSPELRQEKKRLAAEVATLEASDSRSSSFKNDFLAMETSLPDDLQVAAVVGDIRQQIQRLGKQASHRPVANPRPKEKEADYVGWQACGRCHLKETANWQRTRHAGSYRTLAAKQQQFNLNCLPCHVTGTEEETSAALALPEGMLAVGCEVCHGPGGEHVRRAGKVPLSRRPLVDTCLRCHTPEQDDHFDFTRDLKRAAHPEE